MTEKKKEEYSKVEISDVTLFKAERFYRNRYLTVSSDLEKFLQKDSRAVILSKLCRKAKGLSFRMALGYIFENIRRSYYYPFRDEEYLKPHGEYLDILITFNDAHVMLSMFGYSKKDKKSIFENTLFSISNYENFVHQRNLCRASEQLKDSDYWEEIALNKDSYYTKEYNESECGFPRLKVFVENNRASATDAERTMLDILNIYDVAYEFQKPCTVSGKAFTLDFFLPEYGVCIEVDGDYHNTNEQKQKDWERDKRLSRRGVLVVRFTNNEVFQKSAVYDFCANVLRLKHK